MATESEPSSAGAARNGDGRSPFYGSLLAEADISSAGDARSGENHFSASSALVEVPPDEATDDNTAAGFIVLKRNPLPLPYIPPVVFTAPERLPKDIWCPSLVNRIESEYSEASANFLYSIPRKRPALRGHLDCSGKRCTANDTDSENYECFHWKKECPDEENCAFLGPNDQDVMDIIADGGIPLISIRNSLAKGLELKIIRATFKSKFFAVSHVWSGGLGNPKGNTLPTCQIVRFYKLGTEIGSGDFVKSSFAKLALSIPKLRISEKEGQESLLWIDTLCIPVNNRRLRLRAVDSMARIYAAAQSIVIIDHELQQLPFKSRHRASIFGSIFCSAWASRCWTFQEGSMAKEWLVQFDDGLCSIDKLFRARPETLQEQLGENYPYPPPPPDEAVVSSDVVEWYRKMPRLRSGLGQYNFSDRSSTRVFLEIWNNLCLRTTTKKDDLVSIVALMLNLRPSEVQEIPFGQKLLSIFNSQEKLPLGLLFRERDDISTWQQARCWLPSTIEDSSADQTECFMRRRSFEENFFVFECSNIQRFYLTKVLMGNDRLLYLMDYTSREALRVQFLLSAAIDLPSLHICIMIGDSLTTIPKIDEDEIVGLSEFNRQFGIKEVTDKFGVCLGVRNVTKDYVQFFYICPVKCISDYSGIVREDMILATVDENPCLKHGMECVIEHDFSNAHRLSQSRAPFTSNERTDIQMALLVLPYSACGTLLASYCFWYLREVSRFWILYAIIRGLALFIELDIVSRSLSNVEFDEWFTNLYRHKVNVPYTAFYIHYPPRIIVAVSSLSALIIVFSWSIGNGRVWSFIELGVEVELGIILLRWLLELCAQLPAKINLLWGVTYIFASGQQARKYYGIFYAPSRFTLYLQQLIQRAAGLFQSRRIQLPLEDPEGHGEDDGDETSNPRQSLLEAEDEQEDLSPDSVTPDRSKGKQVDVEPWKKDPIGTYTMDIQQRIRDIQERGGSASHLDPRSPFRYLNSLLIPPYLILITFWVFFLTATLVVASTNTILVIFNIVQLIYLPIEGFYVATQAKRVLLRQGQATRVNLSQLNIGINYRAIITINLIWPAIVLGPVSLMMEPPNLALASVWVGVLAKDVEILFRYLIEFNARGMGALNPLAPILKLTTHGIVGSHGSSKDLEACFHILYRPSWLTRKLEGFDRSFGPSWGEYTSARYWGDLERQNRIGLDYDEGEPTASPGTGAQRQDPEVGFARVYHRGTQIGKESLKKMVHGTRIVGAGTLSVLGKIFHAKGRRENVRVTVGRGEYADDGENLLAVDMGTEDE